MTKLHLSLACGRYDRTEALFTGAVCPEGIELTCINLPPHEIFWRVCRFEEFDVSEMSFSSYLIAKEIGQPRLVAIPVFPLRSFRHGFIFVHEDAGIEKPEHLKGKRVGVPEYQMTAALWARGILQDFYGVSPRDVRWFTGGQEEAGRRERLPIKLPPEIDLTPVTGDTLNAMLARKALDAIISPRFPCANGRPLPHVRRLFDNYKEAEQQYYRTTGIFPIMHTVAIREELYNRHPWIAPALLRAFQEAKQRWYAELRARGVLRIGLPWIAHAIEETVTSLGEDFWSYGLTANQQTLEAAARYSYEQGLTHRRFAPEELFAANALEDIPA
jgi:4,5-dihydroxyphthalate decarboxylase